MRRMCEKYHKTTCSVNISRDFEESLDWVGKINTYVIVKSKSNIPNVGTA